jgi:hypothetical protein
VFGTRGRNIVTRGDSSLWRTVARFPVTLPRDMFSWPRMAQRAARADKCNVFVNSNGRVLGIRAGRVYRLEAGKMVPLIQIQGDSVLHGGLCEDQAGCTYFGEYFMNPDRAPVRIWRIDPEMSVAEVAYEFSAGSIRHVHGVFRDPFDPDALWATVGDANSECRIVQTRDRFATVRAYGDGTQMWRAVAIHFTPEHITWITDSPDVQNYACRMDRRTGSLELGQKIDCPAWYGTATSEGILIAFTTVERGPGVQSNQSRVLVSTDAFRWQEVMAFRKDIYRPVQVFKYGVISCPSGRMSMNDVWISGEGLVGLDGSSMRLRIRCETIQ